MPSYQYLRNILRRHGWTAAVAIVAEQFSLGNQAAAVLKAAVEFEGYRSVTNMPRPGPYMNARKRRRVDYKSDPSSYQQISYATSKSGKKAMTLKKLVYGNITRTDFWFKGLKAFDDSGYYNMTKTLKIADDQPNHQYTGYNYPCYIFAPFHVRQNGVTPAPLRRIVASSATNAFRSQTCLGHQADGTTAITLNVLETSVNTGQTFIGPRGMLKWTDFGLNLWGAKNKSTRWTIDFIRATKEDCNPFQFASGAAFPQMLTGQFEEYLRPKVVNPLSTNNDISGSGWKIIKRHVYDLDPIDLQEGDNDPHVKRVKVFNRWDRLMNFDWVTNATVEPTALQFNDPTRNDTEGNIVITNIRPEDSKDVFVMITCTNYVPFASDALFTNATDASFDLTFRSSWARVG